MAAVSTSVYEARDHLRLAPESMDLSEHGNKQQ